MAKIDFERFDALLKESGKTKTHLCKAVGREIYYLNDVKKGCVVPDEYIVIFAQELNTTPEYLTGETDQRVKMDVTLERILSLIPKKENGDYVHGAKKSFAEKIGLKSGNLIADWESGRSSSYHGYVYEIASKYNVSAEWLLGQTDQKEKPVPNDGNEFINKYARLSPEQQKIIDAMIEQMAGN